MILLAALLGFDIRVSPHDDHRKLLTWLQELAHENE